MTEIIIKTEDNDYIRVYEEYDESNELIYEEIILFKDDDSGMVSYPKGRKYYKKWMIREALR